MQQDDAFFRALADPSRRVLMDRLFERDGQTLGELQAALPQMSRIAVMKHLRVLEDASLIRSEKHGRERRLFFNPVPIQMIYDRWTTEFSAYWAGQLARMKYRLENAPIPITKKKGGTRG